ncbi:hypothetical protein H632_c535p0, partial [Helicosporidium sp. ATCC 50920]
MAVEPSGTNINSAVVYPDPTFPTPSCPSTSVPVGSRTNCPFAQSGLKKWNEPATWGGSLPDPNQPITLPENTKVLVSGCMLASGTYPMVMVPESSELIFDDAPMAWKLGALHGYGPIRAGSTSCRLRSRLTLTFSAVAGQSTFAMGIQAHDVLDLHGVDYTPTWTRLNQTALPGDSTLSLQVAVPWEVGQQVVVTTSAWRDEMDNQNEVFTIKAVSSNRRTLTLVEQVSFQHYGGPEYSCEVALLSRSILVQGDAATASTRLGPHIHVMGTGRVSGTQVFRGGQLETLGAYPFHFHLLGDASGQFFTDNSVYRSYYRCYTVHGTQNAELRWNTAFDVNGHCFYLEDGVEEGNVLDHNLAAFVHVIGQATAGVDQSGMILTAGPGVVNPSDSSASGFYVTNAANIITNNAASGGYSGFFFPVLDYPIGIFRMRTDISPQARPMQRFDGNTAHSSGYYWENAGCMYFGGKLFYDSQDRLTYESGRQNSNPLGPDSSPVFNLCTNAKVWLCMVGHMSWGDRMEVRGYEAHDVVRGATMFGQALLTEAAITYKSANDAANFPGPTGDLPPAAGFQWYDTSTQTVLSGVHFANYTYQPETGIYRPSVFYSMTHSDRYKPGFMSLAANISYSDVDYDAIVRVDQKPTGSSRMFNFLDFDGSATEQETPQIVGSWPEWWHLADDCFFQEVWRSWVCPQRAGQVPARLDISVPGTVVAVDDPGADDDARASASIGYVALWGHRGAARRAMDVTSHIGVTGVTGETGWYLSWDRGAPGEMALILNTVPPGTHLLFATRYPAGTAFDIQRTYKYYPARNRAVRQVGSLDEVRADPDGLAYYFDGSRLYLKVQDRGDLELVNGRFQRGDAALPAARFYSGQYDVRVQGQGAGTWLGLPADPDGNQVPDAVPGAPGPKLLAPYVLP